MSNREAVLTSSPGPGGASSGDPRSAGPLDLGHRASRRWGERVIALLLFGCGLISVLTTVGIVVVLAWGMGGCPTGSITDPAPDPDNDVDHDDNGEQIGGAFGVASRAITLNYNGYASQQD